VILFVDLLFLNYKYIKINNTATFYKVLGIAYVIFFNILLYFPLRSRYMPQPITVSHLRSTLKDQFSHPNKITDTNMYVYILMLTFEIGFRR
jgi:hypothetical protein